MSRYVIQLAYDGSDYCGWQVQPNQKTVQASLNNAFSLLLRQPILVTGCGRTDTGVHASYYVAHFDTDISFDCNQLINKLNSFFPNDIRIFNIFSIPESFNARYDALLRTYKYYICTEKQVFRSKYMWHVHFKPDIEVMNAACKLLIGEKDFTSFSKLHTDTTNNICNVTHAQWKQDGNNFVFEVRANRFLRNMVRAMVGTLLEVGKQKILPQDVVDILSSKNRCNAGQSVPAHGLFLVDINYPELFEISKLRTIEVL
jgi:tRNA pseudouridine38-40 synthase